MENAFETVKEIFSAIGTGLSGIFMLIIYLLGAIASLILAYYLLFGFTINMSKKRHRDPLGWVLLSLITSPPLVWLILLIAGEKNDYNDDRYLS